MVACLIMVKYFSLPSFTRNFGGTKSFFRFSNKQRKNIIYINDKVELFVDDFHLEDLGTATLKTQKWQPRSVVLKLDQPWEKDCATGIDCATRINYAKAVQAPDGIIRLYYRCFKSSVYCYAESTDHGLTFTKPNLGQTVYIHDSNSNAIGNRNNNILNFDMENANTKPFTIDKLGNVHKKQIYNGVPTEIVSAFYDKNPKAPQKEKFKAMVASPMHDTWWLYTSADGKIWKNASYNGAVFVKDKLSSIDNHIVYGFDSANSMIWDPNTGGEDGMYVAFFRVVKDWSYRTAATITSNVFNKFNQQGGRYRFINVKPNFARHDEGNHLHPEGFYTVYPQFCPTEYCKSLWISPTTRYNSNQLNDDNSCSEANITEGSHCEEASTDIQVLFSRGNVPLTYWDDGMIWTRPEVYESSIDFSQLSNLRRIEKNIVLGKKTSKNKTLSPLSFSNLRLWGKRRTWAAAGIADNPVTNEFQMYVIHNSWLQSTHLRRYTIPRYRLGSVSCKRGPCIVQTKVISYDLNLKNENHLDENVAFMLNYKVDSVFGLITIKLEPVNVRDAESLLLFNEFDFNNMDFLRGDTTGREIKWRKFHKQWIDPKQRVKPLTFLDLLTVVKKCNRRMKSLQFRIIFRLSHASIYAYSFSKIIMREDNDDLGPCYTDHQYSHWGRTGNRDGNPC